MAKLPAKDKTTKSPITRAKATASKTTRTSRAARRAKVGASKARARVARAVAAAIGTAKTDAGTGDEQPQNPNDKLFRFVLSRPQDAQPLLRTALGEHAIARVDWNVWELQNCTFVTADLRDKCTDLLYRTRLVSGRDALIYVLIEHQSTIDTWMAYRIYGYIEDIWAYYLQCHPHASNLPLVVPVVVHTNGTATKWSAPRDICDLIGLHGEDRDAFEHVTPRVPYLVDDVAVQSIDDLRARQLTVVGTLMLFFQDHIRDCEDPVTKLEQVKPEIRQLPTLPGGFSDLSVMIDYTLSVCETKPQKLKEFLATISDRVQEAVVTVAQQLKAEARTEGRAEGRAEARAEMLLDLLRLKFKQLPDWVVEAVRQADEEQIRHWSALVITDVTLEEMFGLAAF